MTTKAVAGLFLTLLAIGGRAQDFDADSVHYTPIPKQSKRPVKDSTERKLSYFFNVQTGALIGCGECGFGQDVSFSAATVHGVTLGKKLRLGAGIGFDAFQQWHAVPLFGSVSWDLFGDKNSNALFLQFNYGWARSAASRYLYYYQDNHGGRMITTQVGYRIKYHDLKISLGVGTKHQRITASYEYPTYYYDFRGTPLQGTSNVTTLTQNLNRLAVVMSIGWK